MKRPQSNTLFTAGCFAIICVIALFMSACNMAFTTSTSKSGIKTETRTWSVDPAAAAAASTAATNALLERAERDRQRGNVDRNSGK